MENILLEALKTSSIDFNIDSDEKYQYELIANGEEKIVTRLRKYFEDCDEFIISVAFITMGGISLFLEELKNLENRGIKGKILTGDYLTFTEPKALKKLLSYKNIDLKVATNRKHHTKAYFFRKGNVWTLIVGSSNLTQGALTVNFEWNIKVNSFENGKIVKSVLETFNKEFDNLIQAIENTDEKLNNLYNGKSKSQVGVFSGITSKIKEFSGNSNEINIYINSQIQEKELFKSSSRLFFDYNKTKLPENHNGLEYLNLIGMIFEIENIVNDFINNVSDINILYIEEPEAHTHPQLQYIFIRNIKKLIDSYRKSSIKLQTLITTHSSHIVSECNFNDIRYFVKNNEGVESKNIEILKENYKDNKQAYKFLKQYLTLNSAELFFSEKVIFIEGTTERILLPYMMKKIDLEDKTKKFLPLLSQNISIIEIGNHAQIFKNFIEFLNIKVLIITDIDAAKKTTTEDSKRKTVKCNPVEATKTTNSSIKKYLGEKLNSKKVKNEFIKITTLSKKEKIVKCGSSEIMLAYQIKERNYQASSFEDAFISINYDFIKENKNEFSKGLKNKEKLDEEEIDFYELTQECIDKKSSFAIEILLCSDENYSNWKIPKYIKEGLEWLKED